MLTQNLSPQQIEAVNAIDEDVEIIACAGAGKTGVVTRRIVNILKNKPDVAPENIVAFTFTKKAAEELKSRIYSMGQAVLSNTQGFAICTSERPTASAFRCYRNSYRNTNRSRC